MSARDETERRPSATPRPVRVKDPAASMALIFDAMRNPIDPAYADAAERHAASGRPARRWSRSPLLLVALLLIGALVGVSAHALRVPRAVAQDRHSQLVDQVNDKQKKNDTMANQIADLRRDVTSTQSSALARQSKTSLSTQLDDAARTAGLAPASGAGFVMTVGKHQDVTNGADSDPRTASTTDAITSTDLQQLVNGWWQAGASAVSINGQRITSMTAIRFAGSAVLVNFRPLTTPYEIDVVAPSGASTAFDHSFAGQYADQLRKSGFDVSTSARSSVDVPALASVQQGHATPVRK